MAAAFVGAALVGAVRVGGALTCLVALATGAFFAAARPDATTVAARLVGADTGLAPGGALRAADLVTAGLDAMAFTGFLAATVGAALAAAFGGDVGRDAFDAGAAFFATATTRGAFA